MSSRPSSHTTLLAAGGGGRPWSPSAPLSPGRWSHWSARRRRPRQVRIAHDHRHADALLVRALLRLPAVRAPGVAVVGSVDDERVLVRADVADGLHDGAHTLVDRL